MADVQVPGGRIVLIGNKRGIAAYINDPAGVQGAEPNVKLVTVHDEYWWPHIFVCASRDIDMGEPLWLDYGKDYFTSSSPAISQLDDALNRLKKMIGVAIRAAKGTTEAMPIEVDGDMSQVADSLQGLLILDGYKSLCNTIHNMIDSVSLNTRRGKEPLWEEIADSCHVIQFSASHANAAKLRAHLTRMNKQTPRMTGDAELAPEMIELQHVLEERAPELRSQYKLVWVQVTKLLPGAKVQLYKDVSNCGDRLVTFVSRAVDMELQPSSNDGGGSIPISRMTISPGHFISMSQIARWYRSEGCWLSYGQADDCNLVGYAVTFCYFLTDSISMAHAQEETTVHPKDIVVCHGNHFPGVHPAEVLRIDPGGEYLVRFLSSVYGCNGWNETVCRSAILKQSSGWFIYDGTLRGESPLEIAQRWFMQSCASLDNQYPIPPMIQQPHLVGNNTPTTTSPRRLKSHVSPKQFNPGDTFVDDTGKFLL